MAEYKNSKALLVALGISVIATGSYRATKHMIKKAKEKLSKLKSDKNVKITDECLAETNRVLNELEKKTSDSNNKENMSENFIDIIDGTRDHYVNIEETTLESFNDEINDYKRMIPDFFSKNGESKGIHMMYEKMKDSEFNDVKIVAPDLNLSQSFYEEYLDGMISFIQELNKNVTENTDITKFESSLVKAKENDKVFVESLFGGVNNSNTDLTLEEAATDLEILIDFIPKVEGIYDRCSVLKESVSSENPLVKESLSLMYESIGSFCYNQIRNIMDTYYSIMDVFTENVINIEGSENFIPF